jgi:hypothetical protein
MPTNLTGVRLFAREKPATSDIADITMQDNSTMLRATAALAAKAVGLLGAATCRYATDFDTKSVPPRRRAGVVESDPGIDIAGAKIDTVMPCKPSKSHLRI